MRKCHLASNEEIGLYGWNDHSLSNSNCPSGPPITVILNIGENSDRGTLYTNIAYTLFVIVVTIIGTLLAMIWFGDIINMKNGTPSQRTVFVCKRDEWFVQPVLNLRQTPHLHDVIIENPVSGLVRSVPKAITPLEFSFLAFIIMSISIKVILIQNIFYPDN